MFLTRIPLGGFAKHGGENLAATVWMFPVIGGVVGAIGASAFYLADAFGLPLTLAALLAVAAMYFVTGGLHEDGLADVADGFGGGASRDRKLAIMRDSRIGSYGVAAMVFSIGARAAALASFGDPSVVFGVLIAAGALSRAGIGPVMAMLRPARAEGLSASAGSPGVGQTGLGLLLAFLIVWFSVGFGAGVAAVAVTLVAAGIVGIVAHRQIGGQTGDVLGAVAQIVEIAVLAAFSAR